MFLSVSTACLVTDSPELDEGPGDAGVDHAPRIVKSTPDPWITIQVQHAGKDCVEELELSLIDYADDEAELWARMVFDYDPHVTVQRSLPDQPIAPRIGYTRRIGPKFVVPLDVLGTGVHTAVAIVTEKRGDTPSPSSTGWATWTWTLDLSQADSTACPVSTPDGGVP